VHLGVRLARALMMPLTDDHAVGRHDYGADQRVGTGAAAATRRMKQRTRHERSIAQHLFISSSGYLVILICQIIK
jgi:hypothetical protein